MGPVEATAEQRRPEVRGVARWLDVSEPVAAQGGPARDVAQAYALCAMTLLDTVGVDTPDLVVALRALVSAKDDAVRAALAAGPRGLAGYRYGAPGSHEDSRLREG